MRQKFLERLKPLPFPIPSGLAEKEELSPDFVASHAAPECPSTLVLTNGHFAPALSRFSLLKSCVILSLEEAWKQFGPLLHSRAAADLNEEKDPFALLNGAHHGTGLFFYVPPGVVIKEPVQILSFLSSEGLIAPRIHLFLGAGSSLTLVERSVGTGFCVDHIDIQLDENASLFLTDLMSGVRSLRVSLSRSSRFKSLSYSKNVRQTMKAVLNEENGDCELRGLFDLAGTNEAHVSVLVEHRAPHCRSRQHFKFVNQDKSRSSFEGKIYVHPLAQKTESYQLNQNLLLSDEASVVAKPNLEIFADDVKASHGATISQLNAEDLFYFRTRGFSEAQAKELLRQGFCQELLNDLPIGIS